MKNNAEDLLDRYALGECSPEEQKLVEAFFVADLKKNYEEVPAQETEVAYQHISDKVDAYVLAHPNSRTARLWPRIAGIAAAVAAIAFGIWFYSSSRHLDDRRDLLNYAQDIAPGKNTATLTVNGKSMQLSEAQTGVKIDNNKFTYNDGSPLSPQGEALLQGEHSMVTATTPRGGTYEFILQDGTKVWLNADSRLEFFPNYKNKKQRIVKLEGEGYFEVAKDKTKPFIVESTAQKIEVLGTHFNINAYKNEAAIKTTLLEGRVKINEVILKPNQQATVTRNAAISVIDVDASSSIDWKNGEFICANEPLSAIMRKVERWYNVEVVYTSEDLKNRTFDGAFSRYDKVSRILKTIEFAGTVKFKLEGRKVFVIK